MFDCVGKGNNRFYMYKEYSICTDCETYNNSSEPGVWLKIYEILFGLPTNMVRGVKYTTIDGSNNKKMQLPLPPLQEQHRIVAKIEELFTQFDKIEEGVS